MVTFIPNVLRPWTARGSTGNGLSCDLTLSGIRYFCRYLYEIEKAKDHDCLYYLGVADTPTEHILFIYLPMSGGVCSQIRVFNPDLWRAGFVRSTSRTGCMFS